MNVPEILLICGVLIAIALALFLPMPHFRTKANTPVAHTHTDIAFRDDDRYWYGGFLYSNPDDPALFVPKRFGIGWTMNFARPQARRFLITMLVLVLLPPLLVALLGGGSIHSSGCHTFGCSP